MTKHNKDHKMNLIEWIYRKFICPKKGHKVNSFAFPKYRSKYCINCGKYLGHE